MVSGYFPVINREFPIYEKSIKTFTVQVFGLSKETGHRHRKTVLEVNRLSSGE